MSLSIKAFIRNKVGKEAAAKLRKKGFLPGVIYGRNLKTNLNVYFNYSEFEKLLHKVGRNRIFEVMLESGEKFQVFVKDLQIDPLKRTPIHVDLQNITKDEEVVVNVPIELVGVAKGSKAGGVLRRSLWSLKIKVKASEIPETVKIDVSDLGIGDTIVVFKIKDKFPFRILNHENTPIVGVYKQ